MEFQKNGGAYIRQLIDAAVRRGAHSATVTGDYEIEQTVLLPSDFTLILNDCHLRMADGTFCNMFTNRSCRDGREKTQENADRNITLTGVGRAILDGGEYNGLSERNCGKDGRPDITVNNLLLFSNVNGFRVQNLHCRNQRWWALNFVGCRNGYVGNVDFLADYTYVDEQGVRRERLTPENYDGVYIKNADGIDLRAGCHDILIENITGFTEDDTVALTGLDGSIEREFGTPELTSDIYNVIIRNVQSSAFCANIRLLNQSGIRLYNILIDGVMDTSENSPYMERGGSCVRIGDVHLYGTRHATANETANITVRNVYSRANAVMRIAGAMSGCMFENIRAFDGAGELLVNDASVDISDFWKN